MKKPVARTARLSEDRKTLTIVRDGVTTEYQIEDVNPHPNVAFPAFNLKKADGEVYHVSIQRGFAVCTCIAYEMSKAQMKTCKHVSALRLFGFLEKHKEIQDEEGTQEES